MILQIPWTMDDGRRTQQQKVFIKFLRLSSPRPARVGWAIPGTIFCAVADRPAIFVLFIRDVPGRPTKRRMLCRGLHQTRIKSTQTASPHSILPHNPPSLDTLLSSSTFDALQIGAVLILFLFFCSNFKYLH